MGRACSGGCTCLVPELEAAVTTAADSWEDCRAAGSTHAAAGAVGQCVEDLGVRVRARGAQGSVAEGLAEGG